MTPRVLRYRMTLRDRDAQVEICRRLGMQVEEHRVRCGDEILELRSGEHDEHLTRSASDIAFQHVALVVRDVDRVERALGGDLVKRVSRRPETLPNGIRAVYMRGPEGHYFELISFPKGTGDPRWQDGPDDRVIGIDHSAIGVSDTAQSLAFWRDEVGLDVVGKSFNEGAEQESLTHVDGAAVRITSLRGKSGPGVELLEYVRPSNPTLTSRRPGWTIIVGSTKQTGNDPDGHAIEIEGNS